MEARSSPGVTFVLIVMVTTLGSFSRRLSDPFE